MEESLKDNSPQKISVEGYNVGRFIGGGSFGSVYEATDKNGNLIALKIMRPTPFIESPLIECIVKGALLIKDLSARTNSVKIYDAGFSNGVYFISMELLTGGTLEDVISDKTVTLARKLEIALSIAKTLSVFHSEGIIHGDLKPSNILLDKQNNPCLNDFYHALTNMPGCCSYSMPSGTLRYMSPEQSQNKFVTSATDIYSFGILLYEMLTGKLPYGKEPENISEMLTAIKASSIIPPSTYNSHIDGSLESIILKLINKSPDNRYSSMKDAAEDLKKYIENGKVSDNCSTKTCVIDKISKFFGFGS